MGETGIGVGVDGSGAAAAALAMSGIGRLGSAGSSAERPSRTTSRREHDDDEAVGDDGERYDNFGGTVGTGVRPESSPRPADG